MKSICSIFGILVLLGSNSLVAQESGFSLKSLKRFIGRANVEAKGPIADPVPITTSKSAEVLKLLYSNEEPEAIRLAVTHLQSLVPSFLDSHPEKHNAYQQEADFVQFLRVYGLGDEVVAALRPPAGATMEAKIEHAAVAEMMVDVPTAMKSYTEILTQSEHDGVRNRLLLLSIEHAAIPDAVKVMRGLSNATLLPLGQTFMNQIQSIQQNEYDRRLNYVEMVAAYFEQVDPKLYVPADWMLNLFDQYIGQGNYGNTIRLAGFVQWLPFALPRRLGSFPFSSGVPLSLSNEG